MKNEAKSLDSRLESLHHPRPRAALRVGAAQRVEGDDGWRKAGCRTPERADTLRALRRDTAIRPRRVDALPGVAGVAVPALSTGRPTAPPLKLARLEASPLRIASLASARRELLADFV